MNLASVLLFPFTLLLPAAGVVDASGSARDGREGAAVAPVEPESRDYAWPDDVLSSAGPFSATAFEHGKPGDAWQVRIEQRMTIRISPRAQMPAPPEMFLGAPGREEDRPRFSERKIGKCVAMSGIAGVQPDGQSRLLLFMRDRRLIGAELERGCRAGAFYSGFLLSRTTDGQLCVDRDELLSRSGTTCKLARIRQLVATGR